MEELKVLARLRDKGLLSDTEFEIKRKEIVNIASQDSEEKQEEPELVFSTESSEGSIDEKPLTFGKAKKTLIALLLLTGIGVGAFFTFGGNGGESTISEEEPTSTDSSGSERPVEAESPDTNEKPQNQIKEDTGSEEEKAPENLEENTITDPAQETEETEDQAALEEPVEPVSTAEKYLQEQERFEELLLDNYLWGRQTQEKTIKLQQALLENSISIVADGNYGPTTQRFHILALESRGLSTHHVPSPD